MLLCPIFLKLENKKILVIGSGKAAERKVLDLLDSKASVKVISLKLTEPVKQFEKNGKSVKLQKPLNPLIINIINKPGDK